MEIRGLFQNLLVKSGKFVSRPSEQRMLTRSTLPLDRRGFLKVSGLGVLALATGIFPSACSAPPLHGISYVPLYELDGDLEFGSVKQGDRSPALGPVVPSLFFDLYETNPQTGKLYSIDPETGDPYNRIEVVVYTRNGGGKGGLVNVDTGAVVPLKVWWSDFGNRYTDVESGSPQDPTKALEPPDVKDDLSWCGIYCGQRSGPYWKPVLDVDDKSGERTVLKAWDRSDKDPSDDDFFDLGLINTSSSNEPGYFPMTFYFAVEADGVDVLPGLYKTAFNVAILGVKS